MTELVEGALCGDRAAYGELVERFQPTVYAVALARHAVTLSPGEEEGRAALLEAARAAGLAGLEVPALASRLPFFNSPGPPAAGRAFFTGTGGGGRDITAWTALAPLVSSCPVDETPSADRPAPAPEDTLAPL